MSNFVCFVDLDNKKESLLIISIYDEHRKRVSPRITQFDVPKTVLDFCFK